MKKLFFILLFFMSGCITNISSKEITSCINSCSLGHSEMEHIERYFFDASITECVCKDGFHKNVREYVK